jgi:hypothetical protein
MTDSPSTLTAEDIADLNADVGRTAAWPATRTVVLAVGAVCTVGWLFTRRVLRDLGTTATFGTLPGVAHPGDRFFRSSAPASPLLPRLAVAIGLGLRLLADYAVARSGGSLSGVRSATRSSSTPRATRTTSPSSTDLDRGESE